MLFPYNFERFLKNYCKLVNWFYFYFLDLQPPNENGWFWSGSGVKVGPTTQRNTGDWSYTGGYNQAQPDNREAAQGNDESCLSILNNFYNDGLKWVSNNC